MRTTIAALTLALLIAAPGQAPGQLAAPDAVGAKATLAASGGDRLARGRRHRNISCQTQTLAAQEPDSTVAA